MNNLEYIRKRIKYIHSYISPFHIATNSLDGLEIRDDMNRWVGGLSLNGNSKQRRQQLRKAKRFLDIK